MEQADYKLSYDHGTGNDQLLGMTIGQHLRAVAQRCPDNVAVISRHQRRRITYQAFDAMVDRASRSFIRLGIERGDRVAIWSVNNFEWVVTQFATARIGAVQVNINPAYRTHELEFALQKSKCKALILIESFKHSNYLEMFYEVCPEARTSHPGRIHSWRFPELRDVVFIGNEQHPGMFALGEFAHLGDDVTDETLAAREASLDCDDVINIQFTSGTTGYPKGVQLTHHNILNNGFFVGHELGLTAEDTVCVPVPFYHCFGMVVSNLAALTHGAAIAIPAPSFDAHATLETVAAEHCTVLHGVPTMFIAELDHPELDSFDLSSLRTGIMAGAPCPIEIMNRVIEYVPELRIAYGMTESSPVTTITHPQDSIDCRVSTVGTAMPYVELKIVDPHSGATVPRNEPGEICFRGYVVMRGYDGDHDATDQTIDEQGWLHSGDVGNMNNDGYVSVTGRIKDMIIRGGENIYPREIEEFLHTLDIIEDAYVVGIPDPKYGEQLVACVSLRNDRTPQPTEEELRRMCQGQIAHFKIPKYWMIVNEFPMTVTGKVQKFRIRELAIAKSRASV